jgi:hypothetical protein
LDAREMIDGVIEIVPADTRQVSQCGAQGHGGHAEGTSACGMGEPDLI